MKAVSPLIGFVLTIFMTIMITTLTFTVIKPTLERYRGFNVINEASVNLELLSSAINEVATEAEGSKRTVSLSVSDGEYLIDKNSNNIIFTFEPGVDLGVIGRIGDKFLEKGLTFFDFFNSYLDNSLPKNLINVSGNWRVYNNRLEGINGTAYYFIDKNLNGFYIASNFGSDNNLGQIFVSPVNLSGLVLYLTFDEGSGNIAYDYSGGGNNGTLYNGPSWVDGKFGKALSFDGVDDYVNVVPYGQDIGNFNLLSGTVLAWIKPLYHYPRPYSVHAWFWVGEGTVAGQYMLGAYYRSSNEVYFTLSNDTHQETLRYTYNRLMDGNFHFIVFTWNNTEKNIRLFIDGNFITSQTYTLTPTPKNRGVWIGRAYGGDYTVHGNWFNGTIDEVMVFNRSLTDDEIKFLYQEGLKKLQNSGMIQFNYQIKPYIAISNPSGKIYVENLRVGNQNSKEIKLIKPFYGLEFNSSFRFSKGNHQIKIENIGFNYTSKRPIIRISEG